MKCGACGSEFGPGDFCVSCGVTYDEAQSVAELNNPKPVRLAALRNWYQGNKLRARVVIASLITAAFAGGLQTYLILSIGPNQTLDRYISSITIGDFKALTDSSLFPGVSGTELAGSSERFAVFREDINAAAISYEVGNLDGNKAKATIRIGQSTYEVSLASSVNFYGFFFISEWALESAPPRLRISVEDSFHASQKTFVPGIEKSMSLGDLRDSYLQVNSLSSVAVLPGHYSARIEGLGFIADTDQRVFLSTGDAALQIKPSLRSIPAATLGTAKNKAAELVKSCIRSACPKIPKLGEFDFNLWSRFNYYAYTSSRFNKSMKFDQCSVGETVAISATKAKVRFNCDYTAKGHLYVRYTYYSGYYSDYYYYWNFYDTKTLSMTSEVTLTTNDDGGSIVVGSANLP